MGIVPVLEREYCWYHPPGCRWRRHRKTMKITIMVTTKQLTHIPTKTGTHLRSNTVPSTEAAKNVHPCSKVIGIYFAMSNGGILFSMYRFDNFRVAWWGRLHSLWKISWVYVTASRLCEHSNLVRFEKRAAKASQLGFRYGNILMLYD